jgi:hypothetical protein
MRHRRAGCRRQRLLGGDVGLRLALPPAHARDLLAAAQEQVARRDRLLEDAARVAAQVEDDALGALRLQRAHRLADLLRRVLAEALTGM